MNLENGISPPELYAYYLCELKNLKLDCKGLMRTDDVMHTTDHLDACSGNGNIS